MYLRGRQGRGGAVVRRSGREREWEAEGKAEREASRGCGGTWRDVAHGRPSSTAPHAPQLPHTHTRAAACPRTRGSTLVRSRAQSQSASPQTPGPRAASTASRSGSPAAAGCDGPSLRAGHGGARAGRYDGSAGAPRRPRAPCGILPAPLQRARAPAKPAPPHQRTRCSLVIVAAVLAAGAVEQWVVRCDGPPDQGRVAMGGQGRGRAMGSCRGGAGASLLACAAGQPAEPAGGPAARAHTHAHTPVPVDTLAGVSDLQGRRSSGRGTAARLAAACCATPRRQP